LGLEERDAERGWRLDEQAGSYQLVDAQTGMQLAAR
jgi:hypothetical protein